MKCPNCNSLGRFVVVTDMCVWVHEDGTLVVDDQSIIMRDDDWCTCDECEYAGSLKTFEIDDKPQNLETRTPQVDLQ